MYTSSYFAMGKKTTPSYVAHLLPQSVVAPIILKLANKFCTREVDEPLLVGAYWTIHPHTTIDLPTPQNPLFLYSHFSVVTEEMCIVHLRSLAELSVGCNFLLYLRASKNLKVVFLIIARYQLDQETAVCYKNRFVVVITISSSMFLSIFIAV